MTVIPPEVFTGILDTYTLENRALNIIAATRGFFIQNRSAYFCPQLPVYTIKLKIREIVVRIRNLKGFGQIFSLIVQGVVDGSKRNIGYLVLAQSQLRKKKYYYYRRPIRDPSEGKTANRRPI